MSEPLSGPAGLSPASASVAPVAVAPVPPPRWLLIGLAVGLNLLWALSYPVSKRLIGDLGAMAVSCWRIGVAAIMLLPFLRRSDQPVSPSGRDLWLLLVMGLVGCGGASTLQYIGTARTTAANVSLLVGLETSIVVVLAALFLAEPITRRDLFSLVLAFFGVVLLTVDPTTLDLLGSKHLAGNMLVLMSLFCYSAYTIIGKLLIGRWGSTSLTIVPLVVAGVGFIPAFAWLDPAGWERGLHLTGGEALGILFLAGPVTALGYLGWNWLLHWMSAGELSFYLYLQPLAGAALSTWMLGEPITGTFCFGGLFVLGAIVLGHHAAAPVPIPLPVRQEGMVGGDPPE